MTKSKGQKSRQKLLAPQASGFEEFYADVPIQADVAIEEIIVYSIDRSPANRIEEAVRRWRLARNLALNGHWREHVFSTYLKAGGIRTGSNEYQSMGRAFSEINPVTRDFVPEPENDLEIDFEYCARAFFAERCLVAAGASTITRAREAPEVINNFLRYLNRHDVLPEYRHQIDAAIGIGELAKDELAAIKQFSLDAPGPLNMSLSSLFGGYYRDISPERTWCDAESSQRHAETRAVDMFLEKFPEHVPNDRLANNVILIVKVLKKSNSAKGLIALELQRQMDENDETSNICPPVIEVLIDTNLASSCYVGLYFEASFYMLSSGMWYFDTVTRAMPSFYMDNDVYWDLES